eukprot:COSAG01_NODE_22041_length_874_cov_1.575484_1_plen_98_part_10
MSPRSSVPAAVCALLCKANNFFAQRTELDDLACPKGAACHPISTTAICTYSDGPAPPPGPPPPPSTGDYGDPSAGPSKTTEKKVPTTLTIHMSTCTAC